MALAMALDSKGYATKKPDDAEQARRVEAIKSLIAQDAKNLVYARDLVGLVTNSKDLATQITAALTLVAEHIAKELKGEDAGKNAALSYANQLIREATKLLNFGKYYEGSLIHNSLRLLNTRLTNAGSEDRTALYAEVYREKRFHLYTKWLEAAEELCEMFARIPSALIKYSAQFESFDGLVMLAEDSDEISEIEWQLHQQLIDHLQDRVDFYSRSYVYCSTDESKDTFEICEQSFTLSSAAKSTTSTAAGATSSAVFVTAVPPEHAAALKK